MRIAPLGMQLLGPTLLSHGDRRRPRVALTFDACETPGQVAGYDAALIEVLRRTYTSAILFLGGHWMQSVEAFDTVRVAKDGRHLDVSLTISPVRNAAGTIIGASKIARDITARKQDEEERIRLLEREQAARAEAQEAVHLRDVFFSVAGHELRTPLTSLVGNIQRIQRRAQQDGILTEPDQRAFEMVIEQTQRLNRMVEALLDVSRLETGQLSLVPAPLDIRVLARQMINEIQPTLTQHTLAYTAPEQPLMVEGDSLRLEQVLLNLIQNAVKYSPNGGAIRVQVRQEGATACVDVTDNGIGIPKRHKSGCLPASTGRTTLKQSRAAVWELGCML